MRKHAAERSDGKQASKRAQATGPEPPQAYVPQTAAAKAETFEERFERLYRYLYPIGHRFALAVMSGRDREDAAQDAVQSVLIQLWKKCKQSPNTLALPLPELEAYVIKGVKNQASRSLRGAVRFAAIAGGLLHEAQRLVNDWKRPWDDLGREDLRAVIQREVKRLPPECRAVFQLVRFEGLSYKEAAERLGISPATVHQHLSKANARLRDRLSDYKTPDGGWPMFDPDVRKRDTRNHDDDDD